MVWFPDSRYYCYETSAVADRLQFANETKQESRQTFPLVDDCYVVLQAVGFSSEKEQLAYALAEQASMASWNCLQTAAQTQLTARDSIFGSAQPTDSLQRPPLET